MGKNRTFQGFRFLFALGILLSHCSFFNQYSYGSNITCFSDVCFFFLLSGFLLCMTFTEQPILLFLKKKLLRIWPLHLLMLFSMVLVRAVTKTFSVSFVSFGALFLNVFLLQTWIPNVEIATSYYTVSWFLSSLLFCFIVGYFLMLLIKRNNRIGLIATSLLCAFLLLLKIALAILFPTDNSWGYYLTYLSPFACLPDFLIGFFVFMLGKKIRIGKPLTTFFQLLSLVLIVVMFFTKRFLPSNYVRSFYTIPFSAFLIFSFSNESKWSRTLFGNKLMVFLGGISFEIYLIHDLVITGFTKFTPLVSKDVNPFLSLLVIVCITIIASIAYHFLFNFLIGSFKKVRTNKKQDEKPRCSE